LGGQPNTQKQRAAGPVLSLAPERRYGPQLMRSRTALGLLSLILAAAAAAPGVSDAAVTTIGPPTLSTGTENTFIGGTFIEYSGTAPAYVSPIEGTIVTWRIASGSGSAAVRLRVLRPAGAGKFIGVGTSALEMTSGSPLDTFATSLPIKVGDVIGLDNESNALIFTTGVPGAYPEVFAPALADGTPAAEPKLVSMGAGGGTDLKLQINADIQPTPKGGGSGGGTGGGGTHGGSGGGGQLGSSALAGLKVAPNAFSAATSGGSVANNARRKTGATVSYTDSQAATTTFTVLQKLPGRRQQGACVKPQRKPRGKHCTRMVMIGSFTHTDGAGANSFHFTGRVNGRSLKPGGYELQAVARNAAGLTSRQVATGFGVKK
jgi:hypothetical protein